jgi:WD40 repeat protein
MRPLVRLCPVVAVLVASSAGVRADPPPLTDLHGDPLPAGVVTRFGSPNLRHLDTVYAADFSPDGKWIVSSSDHDGIRVWDRATGKLLRTLSPEDARAGKLGFPFLPYRHTEAVSPDGKVRAEAMPDGISLQTTADAEELGCVNCPDQTVHALAFSPAGGTMAFILCTSLKAARAQSSESLVVCDAATGEPLWTVEEPDVWDRNVFEFRGWKSIKRGGAIHPDVAFSPDGRMLATASIHDRTVRLRDAATGEELLRLATQGEPAAVAFAPDGRTVAWSDWRDVHLSDVKTGRVLHKWRAESYVRTLQFAPDGRALLGVSGGFLHLWDVGTGKDVTPGGGHREEITALAVSADGKTVASGGQSGVVRVWDLATAAERWQHNERWMLSGGLVFSPDGRTVAGAGSEWHDLVPRGCVKCWDADTGAEVRKMFAPTAPSLEALTISADGRTLAAANMERDAVTLWDARTGKLRQTVKPGTDASSRSFDCRVPGFSPDGKRLVHVDADGRTNHWDVEAGDEGPTFFVSGRRKVAISPDGKFIACAGRHVSIHDGVTGEERARLAYDRACECLVFSADGRMLAMASERVVIVYEVTTGRERTRVQHPATVYAVAFTPDGRRLITGGDDGTALVWDLATVVGAYRDLSGER